MSCRALTPTHFNQVNLERYCACITAPTRCRKIQVTVHFLDQTEQYQFALGARVCRVKAWSVKHLKLAERDAVEHVLWICVSTDRPPTDPPLHKLAKHDHR